MPARVPEQTWMCHACGYVMDSASVLFEARAALPDEGDYSLCMNCGAVFVRHGDAWAPITATERAVMPVDVRRKLTLATATITALGFGDLANRGGRA
jgi:ribosomal protein L37AE/L43A